MIDIINYLPHLPIENENQPLTCLLSDGYGSFRLNDGYEEEESNGTCMSFIICCPLFFIYCNLKQDFSHK